MAGVSLNLILSASLASLMLAAPVSAQMTRADQALNRVAFRRSREDRPAWTAADMRDVERVHRKVGSFGLVDCKASAFESIRRLEQHGITARFVTVQTETGGYHAIAVIDGTIALDSREKFVTTVDQLRARGYQIASLSD